MVEGRLDPPSRIWMRERVRMGPRGRFDSPCCVRCEGGQRGGGGRWRVVSTVVFGCKGRQVGIM
jgi:hypothetical protein